MLCYIQLTNHTTNGEYMPDQFVFLSDLAEQMGMLRSNARMYIRKLGFEFTKIRNVKKGNLLMLALSTDDAEAILARRHQAGFNAEGTPTNDANGHGLFYIVQPMPQLDPTRLKFGFTVTMESRMLSYRSICPEAIVLQTWPCKAIWERTAIAALSRDACEQIAQELFRCPDIEHILERGKAFFAMLPQY